MYIHFIYHNIFISFVYPFYFFLEKSFYIPELKGVLYIAWECINNKSLKANRLIDIQPWIKSRIKIGIVSTDSEISKSILRLH